jgi:hypothetical protein
MKLKTENQESILAFKKFTHTLSKLPEKDAATKLKKKYHNLMNFKLCIFITIGGNFVN